MRLLAALAATLAGLLSTQPVSAIGVPVANASFEAPLISPLSYACGGNCLVAYGFIANWTAALDPGSTYGEVTFTGTGGYPLVTDGSWAAFVDGAGALSQNVGTATAGTTYLLSVDVMHRPDLAQTGVVQLQAGGVTVATAPTVDAGGGTWSLQTLSWSATAADAGKTLSIRLASTGHQGVFDNVRLTALPVPEPGPWALMAAGLGAVGLIARRRARGAR